MDYKQAADFNVYSLNKSTAILEWSTDILNSEGMIWHRMTQIRISMFRIKNDVFTTVRIAVVLTA
jgi:hypothetical protein